MSEDNEFLNKVTKCAITYAQCKCLLDVDHNGPHLCGCQGSWDWQDDEFQFVAAPGSGAAPDKAASLLADAWVAWMEYAETPASALFPIPMPPFPFTAPRGPIRYFDLPTTEDTP